MMHPKTGTPLLDKVQDDTPYSECGTGCEPWYPACMDAARAADAMQRRRTERRQRSEREIEREQLEYDCGNADN